MIYLVIEDPTRKHRPGTRLEGAAAREASLKGVALIPIDPNIYGQPTSAAAGFFRADYGPGWPLPNAARAIAPMTLCLRPVASAIHWRACVQLEDPNQDAWGQLRLTSDSSQYGLPVSLSSDAVELTAYKGQKTFVVGGQSIIPAVPPGMAGFALWGTGGGKLLWAAISQTQRPTGEFLVNPLADPTGE